MVTQPKIEILEINDKVDGPVDASNLPVTPSDTQVIDFLITLWKMDSSAEDYGIVRLHQTAKERNPNWSISEKRLRNILKTNGLLHDINPNFAYTYADQITSSVTPGIAELLPASVEERELPGSEKNKGLFAKDDIPASRLIFQESPLVLIQTLDIIKLVRLGDRCAHCGGALPNRKDGPTVKMGLDCTRCDSMWCCSKCKDLDGPVHSTLSHSTSKKFVNSPKWVELQEFCHEQHWNALWAVAVIQSRIVLDKSDKLKERWLAQAKVRQDVRVRSQVRNSFETNDGDEVQLDEEVWKQGLAHLNACFVRNEDKLNYDDFMEYLGRFHLNELENNVYLQVSSLNHDCAPNVRLQVGEKGHVKAYSTRKIAKGEELTISYVNPQHGVLQRRRELREKYGFICRCNKCLIDLRVQGRRRSDSNSRGSYSGTHRKNIKDMLKGEMEFELEIPELETQSRRKSVRFDEKVIAVTS